MPLANDILDNITGYSKAMYSTWFYYKPARLLLDAGEGVASALENFIFGIERIFISHGHHDHIGGLPGIIRARSSARGDKQKPLTIYYPEDDNLVQVLRNYIEKVSGRLEYELTWSPVKPGDEIELRDGDRRSFVTAFATPHSRRATSIGYKLMEHRRRLKPEYEGRSKDEIAGMVREHGRDAVTEEYDQSLLIYGGDSMPLPLEEVRGCEVLMHDSTFLTQEERGNETHAAMEEAIRLAAEADVKALLLIHVSSRYTKGQTLRAARELAEEYGMAERTAIILYRNILMLSERRANNAGAEK